MTREVGVRALYPAQGIAHTLRQCLARPLGRSARSSRPAAEPQCRGELAGKDMHLGPRLFSTDDVVEALGLVEIITELDQALPVSSPGHIIEQRVL